MISSETSGYSRSHKCVSVGVGAYLHVCMGVCRICSAHMWSSACVHVYYLLLFLSVWNTAHGSYSFIILRGESNLAWICPEMSGNYPSLFSNLDDLSTFFISLNSWSPPNILPFTRNLAGAGNPILPWEWKTQSWSHSHSYKPKIISIGNGEMERIDIDFPTLLVVSGFLSTWNWTENY